MKSPFEIIDNRLHCVCGNNADNSPGFHSEVISAYISPDESETETTIFKVGLVPMNICNKCGTSWPMTRL